MTGILTEITKTAVEVFQAKSKLIKQDSNFDFFHNPDTVLRGARDASELPPESHGLLSQLCILLKDDKDLIALLPQEGELDPMLLHPGGGTRTSFENIVSSIFSSAFLHMFYLRLTQEESVFVRTVIENFEELKRAVQGENIRSYEVKGLAGITLSEGKQISTPWGNIRPAPQENGRGRFQGFDRHQTKCILTEQKLIPIKFDRAASPENPFTDYDNNLINSKNLLELTYALSSTDLSNPIAPLLTWSSLLLPFQTGFGYSQPRHASNFISETNIDDQVTEIEEWAHIINGSHASAVDIAVQRLVSAIIHRSDKSDALIDAVMVWENLLGTHNEVTFRVSAALATLIEHDDAEKRKVLYKELKSIYGLRSRIVHGASVDGTEINNACTKAIETAIKALQISYKKGKPWLSMKSSERSDNVLLQL